MTDVGKVSSLAKQLKEQYQERVSELQRKIEDQQQEINQLHQQIKLLSESKDYDV
jgi:cell division protein FtsL